MATNQPAQELTSSVQEWLLDSDPAIRWQVMQDLLDAPADEVAAERARVATEGLGAAVLALQAEDGRWGGVAWNDGWDSTMHALMLLRVMGLDPASPQAQHAVGLVRENVIWEGWDTRFFDGEVEPCINGNTAAAGAYFRQDVRGLIDRFLGEELGDGGWNCEAERGSTRSSFHSTICVLEALLEYEKVFGASSEVTKARLAGQEYLLERSMFHRKSTGAAIVPDSFGVPWTRFAFPTWWHYDILWGLDYMRRAGVKPDERVAEAVQVVANRRGEDGRWIMDIQYPGKVLVEMDAGEDQPSRWVTLRALRVLKWYETNK